MFLEHWNATEWTETLICEQNEWEPDDQLVSKWFRMNLFSEQNQNIQVTGMNLHH